MRQPATANLAENIDECDKLTHNCHGVAHCHNTEGSFTCSCRIGYTGDGWSCDPLGDFSVSIRNISKDKYQATPVKRSIKSTQVALIEGLPVGVTVLESVLEWRLVSEAELATAESAEGALASEGTAEWIISKRSVPAGVYQVKFTASIKIGDSSSSVILKAFDYGFIKSVAGPLRAIIDGGSSVRWGSAETVAVDGSLSYDADIGPGTHTGVKFTWSCADFADNSSMSYDCFGAFANPYINVTMINIDTSRLTVGNTYVLRLTVTKDERLSFAEMSFEIAVGDIPQVTLRCFVDCGAVVSASNKFRVTSECPNSACNGSVYEWQLTKLEEKSQTWINVAILPSMTSTGITAKNMIIKQNALPPNSMFRLRLIVTYPVRSEGFSVLEFETAGEPHGGDCSATPTEGIALETQFTFECLGWQDKNTPLSYEFRAGKDPISYGNSPTSAATVLPTGQQEDDYNLAINIYIKNAVGVAVVKILHVKVKGSAKLDPCLTPAETVGEQLQSLVVGEGNKMDGFLNKGEVSQAAQLAMSVLKAANAKSSCGNELSTLVKMVISVTITEKFTNIQPASLEMSRTIMAVINAAGGGGPAGGHVAELALKVTETATKELENSLNDPEELFTSEVEEAAVGVTGVLKNVFKSSAGTRSQDAESTPEHVSSTKVLGNVERATQNLNNVSDALLGRLVPSESMLLKTDDLVVALKKVSSDDIKGLSMEEGSSKFKMPRDLGTVASGGSVNTKMMAVSFNPYNWDKSSKAIQSSVVSLELKSGKSKINVSNLHEDIVIVVPIYSQPKNNANNSKALEHRFLKPNQMVLHSYYTELSDIPVTIEMSVHESDVFVELFVKLGSRPAIDDFDHNFTIFFKETCKATVEGNKTCSFEKNSVTVVPTKTGLLYVGIIGRKNSTQHTRNRRSCFGHGRQRRSCVGFKDPPPKAIAKTIVPEYDHSTDVNYTITITQSSCLYWSEDKDKWTSDGCKVDVRSNSTHLICRCNHLTSFGGNFIQAPNPIDFDKVFAEFGNLAESGNISVLVTICCAFLIYLVVVVFARRADKKDDSKVCLPKYVTIVKEGSYYYDMVIGTGVWRNSGTTANVTITIKGEMGELKQVPLRSKNDSCDIFARGSISGLVLITGESLGSLKEVTLEHDNTGESPSWFVENITIRDRQTEEKWIFSVNRWLAVEKDDGLIEVTVSNKTLATFSSQVRWRFGRKIADSHLWMSVFSKASSSTFTRVQRASCCLSFLFSAMIANALFYNIGGKSDAAAIHVGPFKFTLRQIVIGIQSGIIVAPVNVLIVFLFQSSRPSSGIKDKYNDTHQTQKLIDQVKDTGCTLPHFCVYFAWFLCCATTLTASTFTLFYSLMWGKDVAEQWLSSILVSNGQDIFVVQPLKVMFAVVAVSLLFLRTKQKDKLPGAESEEGDTCEDDVDFLIDHPKEKFKRSRLALMRERTRKEVKLAGMSKEIIIHLIFVFFLAIVCYGNKNSHRFLMTTTLITPFTKFDKVIDTQRLLAWMRQEFIPNIYNQPWYNGLPEEKDVYVQNKMSILVGMPWMRQLRIRKSSCEALTRLIQDCFHDYSSEVEDTTILSLPGWKPLVHNASWPEALKLCPKPWRYQTAEKLESSPMKGTFNSYEGGGYVAVMGYDDTTARGVLNETLGQGWIDRRTRAVILEFAVFNVNTNLLSIATYFYELLATGAAYTSRRVDTLELYSTESGAVIFYLICQFLFMSMVLYYLIVMLIHFCQQRIGFFTSLWNMVDFLMIISSVLSVVFYIIRSKSVLKSVTAIRANPYEILHFHEALDWANWENIALAFAVFMVTVKLLNLIRFNPYVIFLFSSFRQSVGYQLSYVIFFLIFFNAFVITGKQLFGNVVLEYSSYLQAVISQFEFLLGRAVPLDDLRRERPILGPTFALAYNITMSLVLINMLISILNESYTDARTQAEENAEVMEMARFIGERLTAIFEAKDRRGDAFKLYCDESTFGNMCRSDAEPFCLNSQSIVQSTEERLEKLDKRVTALSRRTQNIEIDHRQEEDDFEKLVLSFVERVE
ncbi:polycystin-1-like protein 2 [Montipora capricornis]|uniref:polycystin-1-like protein 2 n=1 Tax=Montipora capricornis TaxID=246305 RepID=UPI0035F19761